MSEIHRFDVGSRISQIAVYQGVAYLAGQIPSNLDQDARGQTAEVLRMVDELLLRANSDKTRILRAQIYLADVSDFSAMNEAWDEWVPAGHAPPRATVEAKLALPGLKVEIVVTAAVCKC